MIPRFATIEDKAEVIRICADPEVRKWTACDGAPPFDADRWFSGKAMIVLGDGACFLSNWLGDRTWGVHTNVLPESRGKLALVSAGLAIMLAFLSTDVETFTTMVPDNNRAAKWFTSVMGFRLCYTQPGKWKQNGRAWDLHHYRLDLDDWVLQGHLTQVGQAFHRELEAQGIPPEHGEDLVHDAYVGATVAMANAGRVDKAVRLYNKWAREAGYVPLDFVSRNPLTFDVRDFLIQVIDGKVQIKAKELNHA